MLLQTETMTLPVIPEALLDLPTPNEARAGEIRNALRERFQELAAEHQEAMSEVEVSGTVDAGDDVADLGTKAFAREQKLALVASIQIKMDQVERALQRLAEGSYGRCEGCGEEIPIARLTAFPSATQCVRCKKLEERR